MTADSLTGPDLIPESETARSPYLNQVAQVLPRILGMINRDPTSAALGIGDRGYWSWKLVDFPNGTFQGAAHGLARLVAAKALPSFVTEDEVRLCIDDIFVGTAKITRRDGSLEEAYPFESSFCVTALVAFDLLVAIDELGQTLDAEKKSRYLATVAPLIAFLEKKDEQHAVISNHLATGAAALHKWATLSGPSPSQKALRLLARIYELQSPEGWYSEYGGCDPGYQTLCCHYLVDVYRDYPTSDLRASLESSFAFLSHFAHPDGSFGGIYGSRNTRFYYPSAAAALSLVSDSASALAEHMEKSIKNLSTVTLLSMDDRNLVPMFNSYCAAACAAKIEAKSAGSDISPSKALPCKDQPFIKDFPEAGLHVRRGSDYYTVVSSRKGGIVYHYRDGGSALIDSGVVIRNGKRSYTTQLGEPKRLEVQTSGEKISLRCPVLPLERMLPSPAKFLLLRCLNLSVMRLSSINEVVKRILVGLLIRRKGTANGDVIRTIQFGREIKIDDELVGVSGKRVLDSPLHYAIHMASQAYWESEVSRS